MILNFSSKADVARFVKGLARTLGSDWLLTMTIAREKSAGYFVSIATDGLSEDIGRPLVEYLSSYPQAAT